MFQEYAVLHIDVILRQMSNNDQVVPSIIVTLFTRPEKSINNRVQSSSSVDPSKSEYSDKIEGKRFDLSLTTDCDQIIYCEGTQDFVYCLHSTKFSIILHV